MQNDVPKSTPAPWSDRTAIPLKAGDRRVLVNGKPLPVPFRILSEENYQKAMRAVNAMAGGGDAT